MLDGPLNKCLDCDTLVPEAVMTVSQIEYGYGPHTELIEVVVPVFTCPSCGEQWTDYRAEKIRDAAVRDHLGYAQSSS